MLEQKKYNVLTSYARIAISDTGGSSPPVLFIHGNSLHKETFERQFNGFSGRRLIALDLPGHGASSDAVDPRRAYSLQGYADCICEVLVKLGIPELIVVGWSLGGHVALEISDMYPGLLGLMALGSPPFERMDNGVNSGFRPNPKLALAGVRDLSETEIAEFVSLIGDFDAPHDHPEWCAAVARTDGLAREHLFESLSAQPPRRQRDLAERCPVPLAMVNGSTDPFVDTAYVAGLDYRNLWSEQTHILDGYGHAPHIHAADAFNKILERFLAEIAPI